MKSKLLFVLVAGLSALVVLAHTRETESDDATPFGLEKIPDTGTLDSSQLLSAYGDLSPSFERNQGQVNREAEYVFRASGYNVFLESRQVVLELPMSASEETNVAAALTTTAAESEIGTPAPRPEIRMRLVGADRNTELKGIEELPGKVNYLIGNDPARWHTNVPTYSKLRQRNLYPGIDLVYYGRGQQLEYDFIVAPGADPNVIQLGFDGGASIAIDELGNLVLESSGTEIRMLRPLAYQIVESVKLEVEAEYVLLDQESVGFRMGFYDVERPLIIDPVLTYSAIWGGLDLPLIAEILTDDTGGVYLVGYASTLEGAVVTISKMNASLSEIAFTTYFGGWQGVAGAVPVTGAAIDTEYNLYVVGQTTSEEFPITPDALVTDFQEFPRGGGSTNFVSKLNATGDAFVYSTYFGGSDLSRVHDIATDSDGNAYITGGTFAKDLPGGPPLLPSCIVGTHVDTSQPTVTYTQDAFVAKINSSGTSVDYLTYLCGRVGISSVGRVIAVDDSGAAYVAGTTDSFDFPVTPGALQTTFNGKTSGESFNSTTFVVKINPEGRGLGYATFLGGSGQDDADAIDVDSQGSVHVTGQTTSLDFPLVNPAATARTSDRTFRDTYVSKLSPDGSQLMYSTILPGTVSSLAASAAGPAALKIDQMGNAVVVGTAGGGPSSLDFPHKNSLQPIFLGTHY